MPAISLTLTDLSGGDLVTDAPATTLTCSESLNALGAFGAVFSLMDCPAALDAGKVRAKVLRGGSSIWVGRIWQVRMDVEARRVSVSGEGLWSEAEHRYITSDLLYPVPPSLTNVDQNTIVGDIITGYSGLAFSGGATGILRKRYYCASERPAVRSSVEELASQIDGFDFAVDAGGTFHLYYPKRGGASGLTFTNTGASPNIELLTVDVDASGTATEITSIGTGQCDTQPIVVVSGGSGFGTLQTAIHYDSGDVDFVTKHVNDDLRLLSDARWTATVGVLPGGPTWADCNVGDTCTLTVVTGYANFTRTMRIVQKALAAVPGPAPGNETLTLTLDGALP